MEVEPSLRRPAAPRPPKPTGKEPPFVVSAYGGAIAVLASLVAVMAAVTAYHGRTHDPASAYTLAAGASLVAAGAIGLFVGRRWGWVAVTTTLHLAAAFSAGYAADVLSAGGTESPALTFAVVAGVLMLAVPLYGEAVLKWCGLARPSVAKTGFLWLLFVAVGLLSR